MHREREDETTPLLHRTASSTRQHHHHHRRAHPHPHLTTPAPYADTTPPTKPEHNLARCVRVLAALRTGHYPSSPQLVALLNLALESDTLAPGPAGTLFQPPKYGQGRVGTGKLSAQGENFRLAARDTIEAIVTLVEHRNPALRYKLPEGVWVADNQLGQPGNGWQDFAWACARSRIHIKAPTPQASIPTPDPRSTIRSSLSTLLHLLLTSPTLRRLLSDLALLVRDLLGAQLETRHEDGEIRPETKEKLKRVVDKAAEKLARGTDEQRFVVAGEESRDHVLGTGPGQTREELQDKIIDRLREVVVELQRTRAYQHAVQDLLQLARDHVHRALDRVQPDVEVEVPASNSPAETATPDATTTQSKPTLAGAGGPTPRDPLEMVLPLLEPFAPNGPGSLASLPARFRLLFAPATTATAASSSSSSPALVRPPQQHLTLLAHELDAFVSTALLEPGWLGSRASYRALGSIQLGLDRIGQDFPIWTAQVRSLARDFVAAAGAVLDDPVLRTALEAVERLVEAVRGWAGAVGQVVGKTAAGGAVGFAGAVWGDVVEYLVPRIAGVLAEIPLPRLEFATPHVGIALEPPSLVSTLFVPARITWQQHSTLTYAPVSADSTLALPPSASTTASHSGPRDADERLSFEATNTLSVKGIQLKVLNVGYFARYKTGIPCLGDVTERGLLDLHFGGDTAQAEDGLGFDLTFRIPPLLPPATGGDTTAPPPLFRVDHSRTRVRLDAFRFEPHQSSHPWLMWFFRPLLRKAVQAVIERELKDKVIEAGAEWVAQTGGEVRRRREELARRDGATSEGETESEQAAWSRAGLWSWLRASWDVLVAPRDDAEDGGDGTPRQESAADGSPRIHLTSHGVAADLDNLEATFGVGAEGVVIPAGEAEIPLPEGHAPKKGFVRAARDEAVHEVQEGREVAAKAVDVISGAIEAREDWRAAGAAAETTWQSNAFDV
ncbi:hypothetical protein JCM3774_000132 [Rhodotorula dairenensis]